MKAKDKLKLTVPQIHLFHSRKKFERFMHDAMGSERELLVSEGQMHYVDGVVAVLMAYKGDPEKEDALLVHEAYHAALAHMVFLGEDNPGEEVMAYLVQTISHALMHAHHKWKSRRGND